MAPKTVKKSTVKPAAKTTVKKTVTKSAVKKAPVKKVAKPEMDPVYVAPVGCGCGAHCHCGDHCKCACHGSKLGRFIKKLIVFIIIFALGFAAAKYCPCNKHMRGPRTHFVNGCMDTTQIKCPKMLEMLPAMDINGDGCITKQEWRAVRKQMHMAKPEPVEPVAIAE